MTKARRAQRRRRRGLEALAATRTHAPHERHPRHFRLDRRDFDVIVALASELRRRRSPGGARRETRAAKSGLDATADARRHAAWLSACARPAPTASVRSTSVRSNCPASSAAARIRPPTPPPAPSKSQAEQRMKRGDLPIEYVVRSRREAHRRQNRPLRAISCGDFTPPPGRHSSAKRA